MNTIEFLRAVLPRNGLYVIAAPRNVADEGEKPRLIFEHFQCETLEQMSEKIVQLDATRTVYHACASYKKPAPGEKFSRSQRNAAYCKSFWLDLDCGQDKAEKGIGYATQKDAVKALLAFKEKTDLPMPLVISSGYGVHAYWVLTEEIEASQWTQTALLLKRLFSELGIITDPSRTADSASILRPVGTHNRKHGSSKEVKWTGVPYMPISHADFREKVKTVLASLTGEEFELGELPSYLLGNLADNSELSHFSDNYEYDANKVADNCQVMHRFRETQGDLSYDAWRSAIGILTFCKDGRETAFKWSAKRSETGHSNTDVATRFDTWNSAPTKCETFRSLCPELCKDCKNKCATPLTAGRVVVEPVEEPPLEVPEEERPALPLTNEVHPEGYFWDSQNEVMVKVLKSKDGETAFPFTPYRFYLVSRIREIDGSYVCKAVLYEPFGAKREFYVSCKAISVGGVTLLQELGKNEIAPSTNKGSEQVMTGYLRDSMNSLRRTVDLTRSFTSFGWQDDKQAFLLGEKLYKPHEVDAKVVLRGHARTKAALFKVGAEGDPTKYAEALNSIYARKGMEPMQYAIASLWGAPLAGLVEDALYKGIPCALTGVTSGRGKTSAFTAGLYAFGNAEKLTIKGEQGATPNARTAFLGVMQSLPILIDEITNIKSGELSNLAYVVSNGGDRNRLQVNKDVGGVGFADTATWCTQVGLTGNSCLIDRLSQNGTSDAEAMRIFEIRVDNYGIPTLDPLEVTAALSKMEANSGVVGPLYISYIMDNLTHVRQMMADTLKEVMDNNFLAVEPKYRFYRWHMVTTITAAKIMRDLGVCKFDIKAMTKFAKEAVENLCNASKEVNEKTADEILFEFIQDYSDQIVTTRRLDDVSPEEADRIPLKKYIGRMVFGDKSVKGSIVGLFFVERRVLSQWCLANRYDSKKLESDLEKMGLLWKKNERARIGRGIPKLAKTQIRCDWFTLGGLLDDRDDIKLTGAK